MPAPASWVDAEQAGARYARIKAAGFTLALHGGVIAILLAAWVPPSPAPQQTVRAVRTMQTELIRLAPPEPVAAPVSPPPPSSPPLPAPKAEPLPGKAAPQPAAKPMRVPDAPPVQPASEDPPLSSATEPEPASSMADSTEQVVAEPPAKAVQAAAGQQGEPAASDPSQAYLPLRKIAPAYPARALQRGIEGDCTVAYTVTAEGRVADARIVGECHPLFVQPSLQAAREFRYRPRVVEGRAVAIPNVHNTFHYQIENR